MPSPCLPDPTTHQRRADGFLWGSGDTMAPGEDTNVGRLTTRVALHRPGRGPAVKDTEALWLPGRLTHSSLPDGASFPLAGEDGPGRPHWAGAPDRAGWEREALGDPRPAG